MGILGGVVLNRSFLKHCTLTNMAMGTVGGHCPKLLKGDLSSSPLIVLRDSFSHQTWARFRMWRVKSVLSGYHYIFLCPRIKWSRAYCFCHVCLFVCLFICLFVCLLPTLTLRLIYTSSVDTYCIFTLKNHQEIVSIIQISIINIS